ncbi:hypothetical protein [Streptomyces sp. NPDC056061]|uniref:hypothetical protein n=1 Tax=Streptomyces sp. NPDC056061 TaxID=3345700 RepID=UPI0035E1C189
MFRQREQQLAEPARQWSAANPNGGRSEYTATDEINGAAFDSNDQAKSLLGDQ